MRPADAARGIRALWLCRDGERARVEFVRSRGRSRARYCYSRRRGEPSRYYGRASDYMPAGLLRDSLLY